MAATSESRDTEDEMIEIVIASKNRGKVREIVEIMEGVPVRLLSAEEVGVWPEIEETGRSYVENALLKAVAVSKATGRPALSDDSGLEVDALDGLPGVHSARFAAPDASDDQNNVRLASLLHGVPPERRRARYRCAAVLWAPYGLRPGAHDSGVGGSSPVSLVEIAVCEGSIATEPKGKGGFGYDPWFIPDGEWRRMAELTDEEKNSISHRGKAFRGLRRQLESALRR